MSSIQQSSLQNRLPSRLSVDDFALVEHHLRPIECVLAEVLISPNEPMPDVFFLESGLASIVVVTNSGDGVEGGLVGREGFVPAEAALGADRIRHRVEVQMAGTAHKMARTDVMAAMAASASFREMLLRFVRVMIVQSACTVLSNTIQPVNARLGRWLLMCDDRSESNDLQLTHRFMAVMLGVRRASVTEAVQFLEGRGLIGSERRYITIRDRPALEALAGDAYGQAEAEYRRLLGPL